MVRENPSWLLCKSITKREGLGTGCPQDVGNEGCMGLVFFIRCCLLCTPESLRSKGNGRTKKTGRKVTVGLRWKENDSERTRSYRKVHVYTHSQRERERERKRERERERERERTATVKRVEEVK